MFDPTLKSDPPDNLAVEGELGAELVVERAKEAAQRGGDTDLLEHFPKPVVADAREGGLEVKKQARASLTPWLASKSLLSNSKMFLAVLRCFTKPRCGAATDCDASSDSASLAWYAICLAISCIKVIGRNSAAVIVRASDVVAASPCGIKVVTLSKSHGGGEARAASASGGGALAQKL